VQSKKWESFETRFVQTTKLSYPFSAMHKWQRLKRNSVSKAAATTTSKVAATSIFGIEGNG
jgi:hypothetical protein